MELLNKKKVIQNLKMMNDDLKAKYGIIRS